MMALTFLVVAFATTESARILVVIPSPSQSHITFARTIYNELGKRGHNILAFVPESKNNDVTKNVNEIVLKYNKSTDCTILMTLPSVLMNYFVTQYFVQICDLIYVNEEMQRLLRNPDERFDLVIIEWNVAPCFSVLAEHFRAPLVGLRSVGLRLEGHDYIGNPTNPSYLPVAYNSYSPNFRGRLNDLIFSIFWRVHHHLITIPNAQKLVNKYFANINKSVLYMEKQVELVLANTNVLINGARPLVPAMVEVGALHVGLDNLTTMDQELKSYLDASKNGFILFNTGTLITSEIFGNKLLDMLKVFQSLPYNIIWQSGPTTIKHIPDNVKIWNWTPQQLVLAHPNIKCFISHGGLLSIQEAIYYKVPLLIIPFLFDQPFNAYRVERLGIGRKLTMDELDLNNFNDTITDVIGSNRYNMNINQISKLLRDQPMKPLDKAVWWIEYVIRNKGYPHSRSDAVHMDWITYLLYDVIIFVLISSCLLITGTKFVLRLIAYFWNSNKLKTE